MYCCLLSHIIPNCIANPIIKPNPAAMAMAMSNASMRRTDPETRSPFIVSLTAFVMAIPGTRGMITPIMTKL